MSPLAFTEDHLLPPSTEKLRLLKLWMRIQNRFFFFPPLQTMTSSYYCRHLLLQPLKKTALSTSQTCHLGVEWRTATTTNRRWCHSFKKESVKSRMREGRGSRGLLKGRGHAGEMRGRSWWCQALERRQRQQRLCLKPLEKLLDAEDRKHYARTQTTHHTAQSGFRMMSLLSEQGCFVFFWYFSPQPRTEFCPHKLYWSALPMSRVQLQPKGPRQHILESDSVLVIPDYFNLCDELPTISCHWRRLHSVHRSIQNNHHLSWA